LIEACLVDVISTCSLTPDKLVIGFEFHEADGTVACHGLALAVVVFGAGGVDSLKGGSLQYFAELLFGWLSSFLRSSKYESIIATDRRQKR
jgi:hypothetical protein